MKLLKFFIQPKMIVYKYDQPTKNGDEGICHECPEAPTAHCQKSIQKLLDVVLSVMELPLHWGGKHDEETGEIINPTVKIQGFTLSHTKLGTRSIQVTFRKGFRCGKVESYKTPMVQIDDPAEGEDEPSALADGERSTCKAAIEEAIKYIGGNRQQMTLDGIEMNPAVPGEKEDEKQTSMDLSSSDKPAKKKPAKKAAKKKAAKKAPPKK